MKINDNYDIKYSIAVTILGISSHNVDTTTFIFQTRFFHIRQFIWKHKLFIISTPCISMLWIYEAFGYFKHLKY